jgi:phosphohistidine phosphatase SixA
MTPRRLLLLAAATAWARTPAAQTPSQGGIALLIRHAATEPGVGDPPGMRLGACATQRNLSAAGRAQAERLGPWLAAAGHVPQAVRSSRWCRCLDTARLAFGRVEPWDALDSFFDDRGREPAQTAALRQALAALPAGRVEAWVTHMVNIQALAGEAVAMGELLVVRAVRDGAGRIEVRTLARLTPPA